ncbi:PKD domain-containing protein [Nocardioides guangzhouensis]|uniref:PKD domain-containing protein n=1 Tax=Nocardioides guangzhouensis TaxID=2497878 RepID=A0A4Q4Z411_9ACTN|nr:PQQ-dependent sugar dehydrogenase [Nocardioides guangzhouensis]RYP82440.1 PKD domain-containing protein [Nocardioides guangzhouensis]
MHVRPRRRAGSAVLAIVTAAVGVVALSVPPRADAATLPAGFQESVVLSGLTNPTVVRFSPDGRVFVAEKRGVIKVFDSLSDLTPDVFADLNTNVYNFWDRGLLGMALAPNFPADPSVYVLYTYDHELGSTAAAPRWGTPGVYSDPCPTPPGATGDGCMVSGRLSRLQASGNAMTGSEQVLVEDWCQQYPSHSVGTVEFGRDGALYASGGDGASFNFVDYGQDGSPVNPCGDPATGSPPAPPNAEGGALRSQDLRTSGDPVSLDGSIIRVNPATGAGLPDNPNAASADPNARRIVAYGTRNPFRFTQRPGTDELWIGDVGWNDWEEINVLDPTDATQPKPANFGWPCYEGPQRQSGYDGANLSICENLYAAPAGTVTSPYHSYQHSNRVVPNESCPTGSSSIAGLQFAFASSSSNYPAEYDNALFFADYSRDCIWVMPKGADGKPAPGQVRTFVAGAANPVNLQVGPGGDLFYVDFDGGTIRRISYTAANQPPVAVATATPTTGAAPLTVAFDGRGSNDPDGGALTYAWDLDGDGAFDDATGSQPSWTYTSQGTVTATLRVTDPAGATATDSVVITVGNTPPVPVIDLPAAGTTWRVGDTINFSGHASDAQDGTLPASGLSWDLVMQHCPSNCHAHPIQSYPGVAGGSFVAPDHEYPSYLELRLTATDSGGLTATRTLRLDPRTVVLTFQTTPGGLSLTVNATSGKASFSRTVIVGSTNTVSAISPQNKGNKTYRFQSWSDGGGQTHTITAPATATTYTARFR